MFHIHPSFHPPIQLLVDYNTTRGLIYCVYQRNGYAPYYNRDPLGLLPWAHSGAYPTMIWRKLVDVISTLGSLETR